MTDTLFEEFIGKEIKAPYQDGTQLKVARGILTEIQDGFVKIAGKLGTIVVNASNIEKMALVQTNSKRGSSND